MRAACALAICVNLALCISVLPGVGAASAGDAGVAPALASPGAEFIPAAADMAMLGSLAAACEGMSMLDAAETRQERDIAYSVMIDSLTALYQLHGLAWAKDKLDWVYAQPDCPQLIAGYSIDGRVYLRLQVLELQNPVFADYTVLLCQLASHSALDLQALQPRRLELELADGTLMAPEELSPEHPLWAQLEHGAATFEVLGQVPSGFTPSFKQVFAAPGLSINRLAAVRLVWGPYTINTGHRPPGSEGAAAQDHPVC